MKQEKLKIPLSLLGHYLATLTNWWIIEHGIPPSRETDAEWTEFVEQELKDQGDPDDLPFLSLICLAMLKHPDDDLTIYNQSDGYWTNEEMYLVVKSIAALTCG